MRFTISLLFALLVLSGCQTGSNVFTDYDTNTQFSDYKTYHWSRQPSDHSKLVDPLIVSRVHKALELQLMMAGLDPVKANQQADLLVAYQVIQKEAAINRSPSTSIGIGHAGGSLGSSTGISLTMSSSAAGNTVGETLIIVDLIDAKTNRMKWRGSKPVTLAGKSVDQKNRIVESAVTDILGGYPPN
jgi:hypothetical protein